MIWGILLWIGLLVPTAAAEEINLDAPMLSAGVRWQQMVEGPEPYYAALMQEKGEYASLCFYCREEGRWQLVHRQPPQRILKVTVADLDLDGYPEIIVGYKNEPGPGEPQEELLSVYRWKNRRLYPLWLGEKMNRPFHYKDFAVARLGREERLRLVTLEADPQKNPSERLVVYRWSGFGFLESYQIPIDGQVKKVEKARDDIWSYIKVEAKKEGKSYTCYMECFDRSYQPVKKKLLPKEYEWRPLLTK